MKKILITLCTFMGLIVFSGFSERASAEETRADSVTINWGQNYCVCKRGQCRKGRWISFRKRCAGTPTTDFVDCLESGC